jgi:hypothetical protein
VPETSTILASLDRFIENFKTEEETNIGHSVATAPQSVAPIKPAEIRGFGHLGHCGHSRRDTQANDLSLHQDSRQTDFVEPHNLLFSSGYNGTSGESQGNCGFDRGHSGNGNGYSGHSFQDQEAQIGSDDLEIVHSAAIAASGPEVWHDLYQERAAIREYDGGYTRSEAELLAWRELECRWHMAHCQPAAAGVCAGCHQPLGNEDVILLLDRNRVHNRDGHACLIRYGERWRDAAAKALIALGLWPPTGAVDQHGW